MSLLNSHVFPRYSQTWEVSILVLVDVALELEWHRYLQSCQTPVSILVLVDVALEP